MTIDDNVCGHTRGAIPPSSSHPEAQVRGEGSTVRQQTVEVAPPLPWRAFSSPLAKEGCLSSSFPPFRSKQASRLRRRPRPGREGGRGSGQRGPPPWLGLAKPSPGWGCQLNTPSQQETKAVRSPDSFASFVSRSARRRSGGLALPICSRPPRPWTSPARDDPPRGRGERRARGLGGELNGWLG